jgi:hypothetical protein
MVFVLMGLCSRAHNAGVTSFVRVLNFRDEAYHRFLHLFHSKGIDLDRLTACWVRLCLTLFRPFQVGQRLVCLADGIKAPKEGKRMPAVKYLHQQSASNSKPEYIMGHSLQAISLLVHGPAGQVAAVPLTSRIHEGLMFSNRDARILLDKLVALLFSVAIVWDRQVLLIADAYYASGKIIRPLLDKGHQLVTRAKCNAVAYLPVPDAPHRAKGRPRIYGDKVRLKDLAKDNAAFTSAPSPVYGENDVAVRFRCVDLLWRPVARIVRFVIVHHPVRGTIFLLCTDISLAPLEILQLYGYRFKIELGFRQAVHVLGAYPNGKRGETIPLSARIMNICDIYDALRSKRPYKPAFDHQMSMNIITRGDGRTQPEHFEPAILAAFTKNHQSFRDIFELYMK